MFDPIEGAYAGPNTRPGLAEVCLRLAADYYGQMAIYLRPNGIVPPGREEPSTEVAGEVLSREASGGAPNNEVTRKLKAAAVC